jgi:phage baseplate assembly protein gpV
MTDCWAYPVHPWQTKAQGATGGKTVYPLDGTLPRDEFRQLKRVTLLVDSRDRDYNKYPSPSHYVVSLPEPLYNVSNGVLISAELPATYYVFSADLGNTTLRVEYGTAARNITIPDGNYTLATMKTALEAALNAQPSPFSGSPMFEVTFDPATSRCTISVATNNPLVVDCTVGAKSTPTEWGLGYFLGFEKKRIEATVALAGFWKLTGTNVANMNPEMYMLIDIEELNSVTQAAMYAQGGTQGKVFAKVPLCRGAFQYSFYDKTLTCNELRPPRARLDRLTISLRFHDGTLVDFHGAEHSLTIELTTTKSR